MKKLIITALFIAIGVMTVSQVVLADTAVISVTPAIATSTVNTTFDASVQINPADKNVCVIQGTIEFVNLSCQNITMASGLITQTTPTCVAPNFTVGIPKCATSSKDLFTISIESDMPVQAKIMLTEVKVIDEDGDVSFDSESGVYEIIASTTSTSASTTTDITATSSNQITDNSTSTTSVGTTSDVVSSSTATSSEATTTESKILGYAGAIGLAIFDSGFVWPLLLIIILALIFAYNYLIKKDINEG